MGESEPLAVGDRVPAFEETLVDVDGDARSVGLDELLADGPVLFVFYTVDFSPDCVQEWCSFRDFGWFSANDEVDVVGVSKSGPGVHRRFIDYLALQFPLYADTDLDVADAFGVRYKALRLFPRARRSCFLVESDRTVEYRWVGEHWLDPTRDVPPVEEVHDAVRDVLAPA